VTQGGDGYGAAKAFEEAGRPRPIIIMGNRQDELAWWKEQKDLDGYETMSVSIAPGTSTAAFWVAQQLLAGAQDIPHDLVVPYLAGTRTTSRRRWPRWSLATSAPRPTPSRRCRPSSRRRRARATSDPGGIAGRAERLGTMDRDREGGFDVVLPIVMWTRRGAAMMHGSRTGTLSVVDRG
jgi:hypothetical protein